MMKDGIFKQKNGADNLKFHFDIVFEVSIGIIAHILFWYTEQLKPKSPKKEIISHH